MNFFVGNLPCLWPQVQRTYSVEELLVEYLFLWYIFQWLLLKVTLHEQKRIIGKPERNGCDSRSNKKALVKYWLLFHYEFKKKNSPPMV